MGLMQRVKVMLGLADEFDDEYYEDDEFYDEDDAEAEPVRQPYESPYGSEPASVRRVTREPDLERARGVARIRSVRNAPEPAAASDEATAAQAAPQVMIHTVEPRAYTEAQSIADKFKAGQPVIMNLTMTDPDLAKRIIDFASGLTYGLDGGLQKVSERVFMLTPANVDVSAADRARLRDRGLFGLD